MQSLLYNPRGKAFEKKAYEIFLIFDFFLDFLIEFFDFFLVFLIQFFYFSDFFSNKVYVIFLVLHPSLYGVKITRFLALFAKVNPHIKGLIARVYDTQTKKFYIFGKRFIFSFHVFFMNFLSIAQNIFDIFPE